VRIPDLARVDAGAHSIAYREAGDGPPLVFLHGFLCDSRCWRTQLTGLADQFRVVAWDAPGAGASSDPPATFTITDWAECLAAFLHALGIERACFAGLSWGGLLAQEAFRLDASRVAGLVLADTYAGWKGSFSAEVAEKRLTRCEQDSTLPPGEFVKQWVPEMFTADAPDALHEEMSSIMRDFHPHGFRLMAKALADGDTSSSLPAITSPTLLLWGEDDQRSPLSVAEKFRAAMPGAEYVVLSGAGHVSNMERPDAFNDHVRRFCSSVR
jgi:pimeloyl-ACP methyl ester carboxylesterase